MIKEEIQAIITTEYFITEISAVVLILIVFGIAKLITKWILGSAYNKVTDIEIKIFKEKPVNDKNVFKYYRKITIFSDTSIMGAVILVYLLVCIPVYISEGLRMVIFFIMITIPLFPIAILISLKRVIRYNKYLTRSILVEGKISDGVRENITGRGAKIEVWYEFVDIYGREHKCRQAVKRFVTGVPYNKQLEEWQRLYYPGKKVNILVNAYETNLSYLPMREDYCKEYHKFYSMELN